MRSQFTSTFQPALGGHHRVRLASPVGRPQLFQPRLVQPRQVTLGDTVFADQRNAILSKIKTGTDRMAQVRKWIASRIDADPMLQRTFGQPYIADNFWAFDDIVVKDQYYVDRAQTILREDLESWDLDEETLARVDEWALVIDNMYQGMQEFGKTPLTTTGGQVIPNSVAPGNVLPPASGAGAGASVRNTPPGTGIQTKDLLTYGGIGLGAVALVLLLKNA
jgi:hypothetical protein